MFTQKKESVFLHGSKITPSPIFDTKHEEAEQTKTLINLPFPHKELPLNPIME